MLTKEQVAHRAQGIGGSDLPIILGLSSYKTPYELYLEKTGLAEPVFEMTEQQRWGHLLEPVVRDEFSRRNEVKVSQPDSMIHPLYDFIRANVDGYINDWNSVLEIKCSSGFMSKEWGEDGSDFIPLAYLVQVAHYCSVMNTPTAHIAVLIGGNEYREFKYTRDDSLESNLLDACCEFWQCVQERNPPMSSSMSDIALKYGESKPISAQTNPEIEKAVEKYTRCKRHIKKITDIQESFKIQIGEYMKDAECLVDSDGRTLVTYKTSKSGSRRFLIKG